MHHLFHLSTVLNPLRPDNQTVSGGAQRFGRQISGLLSPPPLPQLAMRIRNDLYTMLLAALGLVRWLRECARR